MAMTPQELDTLLAAGGLVVNPATSANAPRNTPSTTDGLTGQAATAAINADTQRLRSFNQDTVANQAEADRRLRAAQQYNAQQRTPAAPASPYMPAERGNYNMTNTDPSALPTATGAGLTFGFGGGNETARQYLDRMATQDAQAGQRRQELQQDLVYQQGLSRLQDYMNDPVKFRQQLRVVEALQGRDSTQRADATNRLGLNRDLQVAQLDATTRQSIAAQNAGAEVASRLASAELTGRYGLAAAQARGQSALGAAALAAQGRAGTDAKAAGEAQLLGLRGALAQQALAQGDIAGAQALAVGQQPGTGTLINDAAGNPYAVRTPDGSIRPLTQPELQQLLLARQQATGIQ